MGVRTITEYTDNSIMIFSPKYNGQRFTDIPDKWFMWKWDTNIEWYRKAMFDKKKYLKSEYYVHLFILMAYIQQNMPVAL